MPFRGKLIVFAAPSGAGKTTIVNQLLLSIDQLAFSISATCRPPRPNEVDGKDYYFLTKTAFTQLIDQQAFIEYEEVYTDTFYGTLRSELERLWRENKHIIFDIDVKGALNIKQAFPDRTLTVFVKAPDLETLKKRLEKRQTESPEVIEMRIEKAVEEMAYEHKFDVILVNDDLASAIEKAQKVVNNFLQ